jgi:hypothetical protein
VLTPGGELVAKFNHSRKPLGANHVVKNWPQVSVFLGTMKQINQVEQEFTVLSAARVYLD